MTDRVAIVGSRSHPALDLVREYVRTLPPGTVVISGGAEGVDSVAVEEARARGLGWETYAPHEAPGGGWLVRRVFAPGAGRHEEIAEWQRRGGTLREYVWRSPVRRDVLMFRNTCIVAACTRLVAFPDGSKGGTFDTIREAKRFRRPCEIRYANGRVVRGYR